MNGTVPYSAQLLALLRRHDPNHERQDIERSLGLRYGALLSPADVQKMASVRWLVVGR